MKKLFIVCLLLSLSASAVTAQLASLEESDRKAITETALNYIDGAHAGSAERMAKAIHYELTKVTPRTIEQTGATRLTFAGYTRLVEVIRANGVPLEEAKRNISIDILEVREGLAMVKAVSAYFYDYLQIAEIEGEWKIINILWIFNPEFRKDAAAEPTDIAADKAAIERAALDYIDGSFTGDAVRMERALHPELTKVIPVTYRKTGKVFLRKMGSGDLIEGTKAQWGLVDEDKRNIQFRLLDIQRNIAFIEVLSSMYYDYCHLAKVNGEWKIVNVLWKMNPTAPIPKR